MNARLGEGAGGYMNIYHARRLQDEIKQSGLLLQLKSLSRVIWFKIPEILSISHAGIIPDNVNESRVPSPRNFIGKPELRERKYFAMRNDVAF